MTVSRGGTSPFDRSKGVRVYVTVALRSTRRAVVASTLSSDGDMNECEVWAVQRARAVSLWPSLESAGERDILLNAWASIDMGAENNFLGIWWLVSHADRAREARETRLRDSAGQNA